MPMSKRASTPQPLNVQVSVQSYCLSCEQTRAHAREGREAGPYVCATCGYRWSIRDETVRAEWGIPDVDVPDVEL